MTKYERLKDLENKKIKYEQFFIERKGYNYVVLSKKPHKKKPFFEATESTKRNSGIASIMDIPDLGFLQMITEAVEKDYKRVCKEFVELQNEL